MKKLIEWIILIGLMMLALYLVMGCSHNRCVETLTYPAYVNGQPVTAQYKSEVSQTLWLYFTKTKQIERTTPLSRLFVGELDAKPDPNAIGAAFEGVFEGIGKF